MFIISIDIGVFNLGIVGATIDKFSIKSIKLCELIDIKSLVEYCDDKRCKLYHDKCMTDYINHFIKKYKRWFQRSDLILLERQPVMGFTNIQELLISSFRDKIRIQSPRSMHKYFDISHLSYDRRKDFTIKYADKYIGKFRGYVRENRKHDMADALCLLVYYLKSEKSNHQVKVREEQEIANAKPFTDFIEQFRYQE